LELRSIRASRTERMENVLGLVLLDPSRTALGESLVVGITALSCASFFRGSA
jgi:hypothetical protein